MLSKAIPASERMIIKRDGSRRRFDLQKILRAIALAFYEVRTGSTENPHRDDPLASYGLNPNEFVRAQDAARRVELMLELYYREGKHPDIEQVQDVVEKALAGHGEWEVARSFVLYRANRAEARLVRHSNSSVLSDYISMSKYARYRPELGRREIFSEAVERVRDMHLDYFVEKHAKVLPSEFPADVAELAGDQTSLLRAMLGDKSVEAIIRQSFEAVAAKRVLPSMRSMQFGGAAILSNNSRMFNCSFSNVDRLEFFREYFFLLLSGTGVGFSVQKHHVALLPPLPSRAQVDDLPIKHFVIPDTIEGWCDALDALFRSFYAGEKIEFSYHLIRPRGAPLRTSGGKAPGHLPLKKSLDHVERILSGATGRHLRPIEIYDICMFVAAAVLSGGIRRSATICLFSPDDEEMASAKTGNWFATNPQRTGSNNSAVLNRSLASREDFAKLFHAQKEFGEPGFYFCDLKDAGCNPCVPADTWVMTDEGPRQVQDLIGRQFNALVNGKAHASTAAGFFATGTKPVLRLKTVEGVELRLTANHRVLVQRRHKRGQKATLDWVEAGNLQPGDQVVLHDHKNFSWAGFGTAQEGWLLGSLVGDGNMDASHHAANLDYWGEGREEMLAHAVSTLREAFGDGIRSVGYDQPNYDRNRVSSRPLFRLANHFGITTTSKNLGPLIERTSSEFATAFLRGWFDADGSVQGTQEKGVSIRLSSVNLGNLQVAQRMLLRLGIKATIYADRRNGAKVRSMPDGKGGEKEYPLQPLHDLMVSGGALSRFAERVGFSDPRKQGLLNDKLAQYRRGLNVPKFLCRVAALIPDGEEAVYDCTIPGPHAFDANGIYAHNCAEIGLNPVIDWDLSEDEVSKLYAYGYQGDLPGTVRLSGFQHCNLTSINGGAIRTPEDFFAAVVHASVIGTLQAAYTDMPYLGAVTRLINEKDALLGVSICGFMDNPQVLFNEQVLANGAKLARAANRLVARLIGINPAARVTTVKPEGTASLLLGAASGIHPHHSRRYFRHVQANRLEPVYQFFKQFNKQMTVASAYKPERDDAICFPVEAPANAITRADIDAERFLGLVKLVQQAWVLNGSDPASRNPNLHHNVSNTCTVKPAEWQLVEDFIWNNREFFTGISLLADDGDKKYAQAPREEVTASDGDIARWNSLKPNFVDYTQMREVDDVTNHAQQNPACAGGVCELV